jgi:hypothetical protein
MILAWLCSPAPCQQSSRTETPPTESFKRLSAELSIDKVLIIMQARLPNHSITRLYLTSSSRHGVVWEACAVLGPSIQRLVVKPAEATTVLFEPWGKPYADSKRPISDVLKSARAQHKGFIQGLIAESHQGKVRWLILVHGEGRELIRAYIPDAL